MSRTLETIAVVGASLAGVRAAETLRRRGYDGTLVLVGAESHLPYDRPPLSKEVLRGDWEPDRIPLRKPVGDAPARADYDELELDLRLGVRATGLDAAARELRLDDGTRLAFDGLVLATGASPRTLPGTNALEGLHLLRTLDDSLTLRAAFARKPRVCVVGAGFIGAEVAASARALGLDVVMVDPLPVPCQRGVGDTVGAVLTEVHRDEGVDLRLGVGVAKLEGDARVERVQLADGSSVDADVVVVGIGVVPETGWLAGSGLELDDGVMCDETCATAVRGIVAAGDLARWPNRLFGEVMRVEHWTNAVEQGVHAAETLLAGQDAAEPYAPVPMFWSDQYDRRLQLVGHPGPDDEVRVVAGTLSERRFVALYGRAGRLTGAFAMNRARDLNRYRRLLLAGASWDEALREELA